MVVFTKISNSLNVDGKEGMMFPVTSRILG